MSEHDSAAEPKAVQTDKESQEYGAQHGQTPQGKETGSSSPTAEAGEGAHRGTVEREGEGTGARAGDYS
ncbi:MAG TPA: hypothetical protein VGV59_19255 [Pyrinomonadaceae bacterium]|nr:hypothetical protein [Pyrinomonadaceae bacterium]